MSSAMSFPVWTVQLTQALLAEKLCGLGNGLESEAEETYVRIPDLSFPAYFPRANSPTFPSLGFLTW